jgi:uncharacterized protein YeaO (DUF488 family)
MPIYASKTVYAQADAQDGLRLIVMRMYPRGVAKSRAHAWLPELAPTLPLVHWYHQHLNEIVERWKASNPKRYEEALVGFWETYRARYLREMREPRQRHLIALLSSLHRDFALSLTLLCACPDHQICHRTLLGELILQA